MSALISASDITQQSGALPFRKKKHDLFKSFFFVKFFSLEPKSREVKFSALFFKGLTIYLFGFFFLLALRSQKCAMKVMLLLVKAKCNWSGCEKKFYFKLLTK